MAISSDKKSVVKHNGMSIHFDDSNHVYRVYDKEQHLRHKPISVTTLIHKYQKPFDLEGLSKKCAEKEGVSQQEIKDRWAKINKTACGYGTRMHSVAERIFNGEFVDDTKLKTDEERIVFRQIQAMVNNLKTRPYEYESEKIIFDPSLNIAGTVDLLGRNKETGDYIIIDWKTNKRIRMENEYGGCFLSPMTDVQDCEYSLYGLQLSLYERILKGGEFIPKDVKVRKFICHFHPETGCKMYEVGSTFVDPMNRMLTDWSLRQAAVNEGIPIF